MMIVTFLELGDGNTNLFDIAEDPAMNGLFLQGPVEAFCNAVGLGLGNVGETRCDAPELELIDKVVGRILRPVIHAQRQATPGRGAGGAKFGLESLGDRLQGGETVAGLDGMDADATSIKVIDRREHPAPALIDGLNANAVGAGSALT